MREREREVAASSREAPAEARGMECGGGGREQQMQIVCVRGGGEEDGSSEWDQSSSRSALSLFKEKEEEIERKKLEVREKVFSMLGRVEEETKRLAFIRQVSVRLFVRACLCPPWRSIISDRKLNCWLICRSWR